MNVSATTSHDMGTGRDTVVTHTRARLYDPVLMRFTTIDPMAEKYYPTSPYAYCQNDPLGKVDLDGMGWMVSSYNNETFYFYDKDIHGQEDIINKYGSETQVQYVTDEGALVYLHTQSGDNVFKLNQDGSFSLDGVKQNEEYDKIGVLHIGNDKLTKGINKNWYGSYLGPDNPLKSGREDGKSKYSYAFPPLNDLDYAAYQHDRAYDTMGAVGVMGALLNTETANADLKLACDALCIVSQNKFNFQSTKVRWASAVCRLFSEIAIAKAILNSPK
ncbi:MAG: RHS repeat-associated core domain-containing protein [Bacteroidales bacterium]|nr:RHS repeat-associated core domain-containing protein [Bacteroidales bacterium]